MTASTTLPKAAQKERRSAGKRTRDMSGFCTVRNRELLVLCLKNRGISERELSRRAALSHSTVNHLFTGRRFTCTVLTARSIEKVLGLEAGVLFAGPSNLHRRQPLGRG